MNIKIKIGIVGLSLISLFVGPRVFAQESLINTSDTDFSKGIVVCGRNKAPENATAEQKKEIAIKNAKECDFAAFMTFINRLVNYAIIIATLIMTGMIAYTGFEYLNARDNPGTLAKLKDRLWAIIIGITIMLSSWLIFKTLADSVLINDYIKYIYLK